MSVEAVSQFLDQVQTDTKLQEDLAKVIESAENDREAATNLGKEYGYEFSSEELWAEVQKRQEAAKEHQAGELTDEELEAVAGGGEIWITTVFTATTAIATALIPKIKW